MDDEGCEEEDGGCHPRMLHGDNRLVQFNLQSNSWTNRGNLGRNTDEALQTMGYYDNCYGDSGHLDSGLTKILLKQEENVCVLSD